MCQYFITSFWQQTNCRLNVISKATYNVVGDRKITVCFVLFNRIKFTDTILTDFIYIFIIIT